ncbi:unnamed protein product, partial [Polarella glacialis]
AWEVAWDAQAQRWYFHDRINRLSVLDRPSQCSLEIPSSPPANDTESLRAKAVGLPEGWKVGWDTKHQRHFYFNRETAEQTWIRPGRAEAAEVSRPIARCQICTTFSCG